MTGTVLPSAGDPTLARLIARLRAYESIRMSDTETMVLVPTIGSLLVERLGPGQIRFEIAAESAEALDLLAVAVTAEITRSVQHPPSISWARAVTVPVSFR